MSDCKECETLRAALRECRRLLVSKCLQDPVVWERLMRAAINAALGTPETQKGDEG